MNLSSNRPDGARPVLLSVDEDHVGWLIFDAPESRVNLLDEPTRRALSEALDGVGTSDVRAVVITSAKESIFIAGADLHVLQELRDEPAAEAFSREGQALMQRIADLRIPVVCAIHGACAGGGFELALACHWRIASDSASTRIGLPETGIGTIPGWGGCVRLSRLVGAEAALTHILRAELIGAKRAQAEGLIDEVAPASELRATAKSAALRLAHDGRPIRPAPPSASPESYGKARTRVVEREAGGVAARLAAIDAVEQGASAELPRAFAIEAAFFGRVTATAECRNLIHAFFLRDSARKRTLAGWFDVGTAAGKSVPVQRIGVVGAGVMGSGIAHWAAVNGVEVVLRDLRPELVDRGVQVIQKLLEESVRRGRLGAEDAGAAMARVRTTATWDGFDRCDLVVEAVVENVEAKRRLFAELAGVVGRGTLLASNTSALPIEEIAGHVVDPGRTLGLHFFNPVSRMGLVELVLSRHTSADAAGRALAFVRRLGKSAVICRSSPGFLVTRVLFFYLNAAVQLWEEGVSTHEIDGALREFGWPMGPLRLIDEVGIDVAAFIFGEMAHYFPDRFAPTTACQTLASAGLLGRKNSTGRGFYTHGATATENEAETRRLVPPAGSAASQPLGTAIHGAAIVEHLMGVMAAEAHRCLDERIVQSAEDIDFALLSGTGFPAWRGGLLHWADTRPELLRRE